jgi:multidrug resistance efflux pump
MGVLFLGLAGWLAIPPLVYPTSRNAVINARLVPIRNSYEGQVTLAPPPFGTSVERGSVLARIENRFVSRRHAATLRADLMALQDQLAALVREKEQIEGLQRSLAADLANYKTHAKANLETRMEESQAQLRIAAAQLELHAAQVKRFEALMEKQAVSPVELQNEQTQRAIWENRAGLARAELDRYRRNLEALGKGVFLEWGTASPYSHSRSNELEFEKLELDTKIQSVRGRLAQTQRQWEIENEDWNQRRLQEFRAPTEGVVWRRLVQEGTQVDAYTDLMQVVLPDRVFVEAAVAQEEYDWIEIGDEVDVRLPRRPFLVLHGHVVHKLGAGAKTEDQRVAGGLAETSEYEFRVHVELTDLPPGAGPGNFYHVGRRVNVRFKRSRFERWVAWNG